MIDLYSDTKTVPTAAMRDAIQRASVGDEQADEDPTTRALCERVASELGYDAAVFMPSGTMCNLVATLTHTRPGDELIADAQAHICMTEGGGAAAIAGVSINPIDTRNGIFTADQLQRAMRERSRTAPRSAMISVEQTTNFSGGAVWPLDALHAVRDIAKAEGLRTHIDGARLYNASVATGISPACYTKGWDSAWIDFSKGLGCPIGAVLCGTREFVRDAWVWKYRLGGAMRQSGMMAAAALYALDHHVARLVDDHHNAACFVTALRDSPHFEWSVDEPSTNIVMFRLKHSTVSNSEFVVRALRHGVRLRALYDGRIRVTTHLGVSRDNIMTAASIVGKLAASLADENATVKVLS